MVVIEAAIYMLMPSLKAPQIAHWLVSHVHLWLLGHTFRGQRTKARRGLTTACTRTLRHGQASRPSKACLGATEARSTSALLNLLTENLRMCPTSRHALAGLSPPALIRLNSTARRL